MKRLSRPLWVLAVMGGLALPACRITPEEVQRIETENELLRRQIQTIREHCDYYSRELEIEVEKGRSQD